ncbi:unnamed protein product [Lymnaea stagnalis]|uniref:BTB domain-containing protein n=1 Tax=Lymnaea stagnalis TaxID=6523 RepID=A0AAV2ISK0_LYMST
MDVHQDCAVGIAKCLKSLWEQQDYLDYEVKVEDETFKCHRLILAACSPYFDALFRSDLKETRDGFSTLRTMSSTTFQLILTAIYTGSDVLTDENVIDVWNATHLLQIDFMIKHCEKRVVQGLTLDNFEEMYALAKLLDSKNVADGIVEFTIRHFNQVKNSNTFWQLAPNEFLSVVKSQDLMASSEDCVLESILKWVDYYKDETTTLTCPEKGEVECPNYTFHGGNCKEIKNLDQQQLDMLGEVSRENIESEDITDIATNNVKFCGTGPEKDIHDTDTMKENSLSLKTQISKEHRCSRLQMLAPLLKSARTCIASPTSLDKVYKDVLVQADHEAKNIIYEAVRYQLSTARDGQWIQWPSASIYRACNNFDHFGVFVRQNGASEALSLTRNKWFKLEKIPFPDGAKFVNINVFNKKIYALTGFGYNRYATYDFKSEVLIFRDKKWETITQVGPLPRFFLISHGDYIYILATDEYGIYRINLSDEGKTLCRFTTFPDRGITFTHAMAFEKNIIAFYNVSRNCESATGVYRVNLNDKQWEQLDILPGSANGLTHFKYDSDTFILQGNGNLHKIAVNTERDFLFEFIERLWENEFNLQGAFMYSDNLIVFAADSSKAGTRTTLQRRLFKDKDIVINWITADDISNVVPVVLSKNIFEV